MTELDRVDDLLRRTSMALIYQCMLPPDANVTKDHLWHCIRLAQDIENLYRARGHWTQGASGALVDMSTARLEAVRAVLYPDGQRGDPEQARRKFDDAVAEIAPYFADLTEEEMQLIADSKIPDEHVWHSDHPPTAGVVCTPGTVGGRPRIDGTRIEISTLLLRLRDGMTIDEISKEWRHLPQGWFDAIIGWIDGHGEPR